MRDLPRKTHCPEIDLLESKQPAQSASEKPERNNEDCMGKNKP